MSRFLIRQPHYSAEGGAGVSNSPPSSTPDITHDESGYEGSGQLVGADDILTPDKFPQNQPTTKEDIASIGAEGQAEPDLTPNEKPEAPAGLESLFEEFDKTFQQESAEAELPLPEGVDPGSATAQIFRQQAQQLRSQTSQLAEQQRKFQEMGYAYDQTVNQMRQQMALLQQQIQMGGQQQQQAPQGPPPGMSMEEFDAYNRLSEKFKTRVDQEYNPRLQQLEEQLEQTRSALLQQQQNAQKAAQRQKFLRDARNVVDHVVFKPLGLEPQDNPEIFGHMMDMTFAIANKTGQPLGVCAKAAADRSMAFVKAWYQKKATRSNKAHQTMKSEPKQQPSGGMPLRGDATVDAELLKANGYNSEYEWRLRGSPGLTRRPAAIPEFQLGDET